MQPEQFIAATWEDLDMDAARQLVANFWREEDEIVFAGEVLAGCWDHRNDVQAALRGTFDANRFREQLHRT